MSDLSQLEEINENDLLDALHVEAKISSGQDTDELTNIPEELLDPVEIKDNEEDSSLEISEDELQTVQNLAEEAVVAETSSVVTANSLEGLSEILSKLLNNKTIEITIRVKD